MPMHRQEPGSERSRFDRALAGKDGIGPTADWQGYWQRTDDDKRKSASWANGR